MLSAKIQGTTDSSHEHTVHFRDWLCVTQNFSIQYVLIYKCNNLTSSR